VRLALAAALALAPAAAWAATGAPTLQRPFGARGLGMAQAFTAVPGGLESAGYNPAGLVDAKRPALTTNFTRGLIEDSFGYVGYAHPLKFIVLHAGALYYDAGTIDLNLSNGTRSKVKAAQDYVGMVGAAIPLPLGFSAGGIAKFYRFSLAEAATAKGYAADVGAQWRTPLPGLTLGAAVQNAGPDVKFEVEGDKLPLTSRAGAAYLLDLERMGLVKPPTYAITQFLFTAEVVKTRDADVFAAGGIELVFPFRPTGRASLRGGYVFNNEERRASFGIGLKEGRFLFDYAFGISRALENTQNFAVGIEF
jgi:hypothetical protein